MTRHFYRCVGCLEVVAVDGVLERSADYAHGDLSLATCCVCGERFEYMGRVGRHGRLVGDRVECKCDDRCVNARGPRCLCECGGKNHGAGLAGYVRFVVDRGAAPVLEHATPERRALALARRQEYVAALAPLRARYDAIVARGGWLPADQFAERGRLRRVFAKARAARTHAGRMKALQTEGL